METPIDFPIQFLCVSFIEGDQSILSKSFNSLSAYALILIFHCNINLFSILKPPLSDTPFTISSLANTVPNSGHQLTSELAKYAIL